MKELWKENKLLCLLTIIASIIILSYYISYDWPELIHGIGKWFDLLNNLSLAVLANFVFFIFNVFLPQKEDERKAFSYVRAQIEWLYFLLSDIVLVTERHIVLDAYGKVNRLYGIKHLIRFDEGEKTGWLIRVEFTEEGIRHYSDQINKTVQEITQNASCFLLNHELLEKISLLQTNRYMNYLLTAVRVDESSNERFGDLLKEYSKFKDVMYYLGVCIAKSCLKIQDASAAQISDFESRYTTYDEKRRKSIPRKCVKL